MEVVESEELSRALRCACAEAKRLRMLDSGSIEAGNLKMVLAVQVPIYE